MQYNGLLLEVLINRFFSLNDYTSQRFLCYYFSVSQITNENLCFQDNKINKLKLHMECFRKITLLLDCNILDQQSKIKKSVLKVDQ